MAHQTQQHAALTPPHLRNGSPTHSPTQAATLTPAQKQFLDDYYSSKQEKQNAKYQITNLSLANKSPMLNAQIKLNQSSSKVITAQTQRESNPSQSIVNGASSFVNLSMRNANKTITIQRDSFLKSQRDNQSTHSSSNYNTNNTKEVQQQPLFTAQRLKITSKSPTQPNPLQSNNNTSLPLINQALNKNSSFLKQRKSYDNKIHHDKESNDYANQLYQDYNASRKQSFQIMEESVNESKISEQKPFVNPNNVRLKLKGGQQDGIDKEIVLDKVWLRQSIPHIAQVIKDVRDDEGVEITINCNVDSFNWIIDYLKNPDDLENAFANINEENCLNILVSSCFLGLTDLYDKVWRLYFSDNIATIINKCQLNLKNINKKILDDIAEKIDDEVIDQFEERKDKFISNVYKAKAEYLISKHNIQACMKCNQVLDKQTMKNVSCIDDKLNDSYIDFNGKLIFRHTIDQQFHPQSFVTKYRDKYRLCWKEIYLKVLAICSECFYCQRCNNYYPMTQITNCKYHTSTPLPGASPNEVVYICCMKNDIGFQGCSSSQVDGCQYDFHDSQLNNYQQSQLEKFKIYWPLIKDNVPQEVCETIIKKFRDSIKFYKPQSFNFEVSLSQAYREMKTSSQTLFQTSDANNVYDDILFRASDAQKTINQLDNDKQLRDQISKQAKSIVRSKSPDQTQSGSTTNLMGTQYRVTLDVESNQPALRKRSLSPQQIKEIQIITRKKIWEFKRDIIREDDLRSMRLLSQLLKQQRVDETQQGNVSSRVIQTNKDKHSKHNFLISINQISSNAQQKQTKIKDTINSKRSNNSTERRKKSPSFIIKQNQIIRKGSPN